MINQIMCGVPKVRFENLFVRLRENSLCAFVVKCFWPCFRLALKEVYIIGLNGFFQTFQIPIDLKGQNQSYLKNVTQAIKV